MAMEAKLTERSTGPGSAAKGKGMRDGELRDILLNRNVRLIDEVAEFIRQSGGPSLTSILDALHESIALQPGLTQGQRNAAEQTAIRREILNYRVQYEEPAAAALRRRKMESPRSGAALIKLANGIADKGFLDALDLDFSRLTMCPHVSSLALHVSPELSADAVNKFACCAFVARANHNMIVFYVGPYRPCLHGSGFYLIYDADVKTLAAAPQLPNSISLFSHCCIGSGAAVVRISPPTGYILVELLLRLGSNGLPTSNATLLTWSNCINSLPPRWIETEVLIPQLPYPLIAGYSFHADTVFPVGRSCLCWADLTLGIILCKDLLAQDLEFTFVPLPEGLSCDDRLHGHGRGWPEERRCMSCSTCDDNTVIRFACLENNILTRWTFDLCDMKSGWKEVMSFAFPTLPVSCPLLSAVEDNVVYVDVNNKSIPGFRVAFRDYNVVTVAPELVRVTHKIITSSSCF